MIRLLIVSNTRMMGELLASVLREEREISVIGFAHDENDAIAKVTESKVSTVLVDANMEKNDALNITRSVRAVNEDVKIIVTGLVNSKSAILRCVEEGVNGYVLEDDGLADLVNKIYAVRDDRFVVSPDVASALIDRIADLKQMTKELYGLSLSHRVDGLFAELTPREWEVLQLIEQGYDNQMIANELVIEKGTVKNHVHSILSKLDVSRREHAAVLFRQMAPEESHTSIPEPMLAFPLMDRWKKSNNDQDGDRQKVGS